MLFPENRIFLLVLLLMMVGYSCEYNTSYEEVGKEYGVSGVIKDISGKKLDSVEVYYLFNFYFSHQEKITEKDFALLKSSPFSFKLYQNYPNPFSKESFVKFSLPSESSIRFTISDIRNSHEIYQYKKKLQYGLYQMAIGKIVDSLKLVNGMYRYSLYAKDQQGTEFEESREFLLLQRRSNPNSVTDTSGVFTFDYEKAPIGKVVTVNYYDKEENLYQQLITTNIGILFKRKGYREITQSFNLYPNILLHQDVIMVKE